MACECDVYFVNRAFDQLVKFEPSTSLINGFDRENECVSGYGTFEEKDKCCGTFPDRFPFSSRDGNRGCCNSRTYDTSIMECCEDGQLRYIYSQSNFRTLQLLNFTNIFGLIINF